MLPMRPSITSLPRHGLSDAPTRRPKSSWLLTATLGICIAQPALAQVTEWTGNGPDNDWSSDGNWTPGEAVPTLPTIFKASLGVLGIDGDVNFQAGSQLVLDAGVMDESLVLFTGTVNMATILSTASSLPETSTSPATSAS